MGNVGEIMRRILHTGEKKPVSITSNLRRNFMRYGAQLDVHDLEEYAVLAQKFFEEHMYSSDPRCTRVVLPDNNIGIDFDGKYRGIYAEDGTPEAFFSPDYHEMGFQNRQEMLDAWRENRALKRREVA